MFVHGVECQQEIILEIRTTLLNYASDRDCKIFSLSQIKNNRFNFQIDHYNHINGQFTTQ